MNVEPNILPDIDSIKDARQRIQHIAFVTPLLRETPLNDIAGMHMYLKAECLQRTGSFKFRGAFNAVSRLSAAQREKGVITCSSGNHGQGIAEAARLLGARATIVMPSDAPALKVNRVRRSGGEVVLYDRATEDREAIAGEIQARTGAAFIHPYEHPDVIAGQGTCGLEIGDQMAELGTSPDRMVICAGGGGLSSGIAIAILDRFPDARIYTAEPAGFDDISRSLKSGKRESNPAQVGSTCDALLSPMPGRLAFEILRERGVEGLVVEDREAHAAVRTAFAELKLVLEPSGAVALAAALANAENWRNENVVCILSGGNVDSQFYSSILAERL